MAKLKEAKGTGEPGWFWRRIMIFWLIGFACWRLMMMEGGADTRLNDSLTWGWFLLLFVLALLYTGLATVQDIVAIWRTRSGLPYNPQTTVEPQAGDIIQVNNAPGGVQQATPPADTRAG